MRISDILPAPNACARAVNNTRPRKRIKTTFLLRKAMIAGRPALEAKR